LTVLYDDIAAKPTFDDENKLRALDVSIGGDSYGFELDTMSSPVHYIGNLVSSSLERTPARSWCWIECAGPMLAGEVLDEELKRLRLARRR
jgi:hypothetical protein